jgi:VWFA-related protein
MRRSLGLILAALFTAAAIAQTPATAQTPAPPAPQATGPIPTLQANTQLVVVDVVVQDKDGHPVHGLKVEDFHLTEGKTLQTIRHFEEHSTLIPVEPGPQLPPMPPGTFTDYTPIPPNGTLNILLLDALNTPTKDQAYVRDQLQEYVKNARPGTRIAIFGLANQLIILQGFTSDPQTLKDAVDHKLIPRNSSLLDDPTGSGVDQPANSGVDQPTGASAVGLPAIQGTADAALAQSAANLQQFEAETAALEIQLRIQYTLDAFNTLAHYLAGFPGRKNLIWFSGSFPINIFPDGDLQNPFSVMYNSNAEFRETTNLLGKAQVAVYPIDARGLATPPMYSAASSGASLNPRNPQTFSKSITKFNNSQAQEHGTMDELADQTGGKAAYNTNGIAAAVEAAVNSGANYYTLSYSPTDQRQNGAYRTIHIDLAGAAASVKLSYRRGYYADDARDKHNQIAAAVTDTTRATASAPDAAAAAAYSRAAMSRGAPSPTDLLFKVRVLPASKTTETAVAQGNALDRGVSPTGPFRRFDVDFVALPSEFKFTLQPDGKRTAHMSFIVYVFDADGRLLNAAGQNIELNLPPESYVRFRNSAIQRHLEISVPIKTEAFLRVGIKDVSANKFGVVELPVDSVSRLAPAVYAAAPAAPATTTPAPSNSPPASIPPATPAPSSPQD